MGVFTDLIDASDDATAAALRRVLDTVLAIVPDAVEDLSYGTPALRYRGSPLLGARVAKAGISLFPFSPEVVSALAPDLAGFSISKGTIRFTVASEIPDAILRRMVALRRDEIEARQR